jgi:hypothetical protein
VLLWVSEGQSEDLAEARMAHAVAALEFGRLAPRDSVVPAAHAHGGPTPRVRTANCALACRTGTDRSAAFSGRGARVGVAKSGKKVERLVEDPRL